MGRSTPKTNEAVPVPKDGPLCWLVNTANAKEIAAAQNLVGTKESLDLLSLSKRENDESETAETSPSQILWRILTNSNQIRPQLQALQAYKSKVLHIKRSGEIGAQHDELVGTYKLLLEWGMSHVIPSPLKRAIQSNLGTLESIIDQQEAYRIRAQVTASLFDDDAQQQYWSDPLGTLFEMLNYESTRCITVKESDMSVKCLELLVRESDALQPILDENAFGNNDSPETVTRRAVAAATEKCAFIANTLKLFLTALLSSSSSMTEETMRLAPLMETMQLFLKSGLTCRGMPADELNVIGVVYGQALLFHWKISSQDDSTSSFIANKAADKVFEVTSDEALLPPLNKLAVVQGITATIPNEALVEHSPPIFSDPLATYVLKQCRTATGAAVRLSALRTLHTLINRCVALMSTPLMEEWHLSYVNQLTNDTLEVVLQSWESPPARQVATAVPGLFRSLIALLRKSDGLNGTASSNLNTLVKRILDLPSNRKGKYVALESLLPQVGAKFLNDVAGQELIASLIAGIGEGNHNIVAISDLLGELLSRARVEMNEEAGLVVTTGLSKKERRRLEKIAVLGESDNGRPSEQELPFLPEWVALWCPRLALALVSGSESERKHISTRCIPLLTDIVGGVSCRHDATYAFSYLLEEVRSQLDSPRAIGEQLESYAGDTDTLSDRVLWATFQIAKQASIQKLMKPPYAAHRLVAAVSKTIPPDVLESSLTHSSQSIRLVAFASIEAVVPTYFSSGVPPLQLLEKEVYYWRIALPFVCKSGSKAFNKELLLMLGSLLNRLSDVESECPPECLENGTSLPILTSFVCDFLITEMFVQKCAYPGTVEEKEGFALALFHCILSFVSQDGAAPTPSPVRVKPGGLCRKSPRVIEVMIMRHILTFLLSDESISALFSLLHSTWDNTRGEAFNVLYQVVEHAHARGLLLPNRFSLPESIRYIQARSIYLASSPRQREADTGSRILAFIGALNRTEEERREYNMSLLALLDERLDIMMAVLGVSSCNSRIDLSGPGATLLGDGSKMPIVHGFMMALRLTVENKSIALRRNDPFYESFVTVCCRAIQLSLAVVADLKDGATIDEDESEGSLQTFPSNTPLNVNTGAIGANTGFSSIQRTNEDETQRRFAFQRIIMGSWLMIKEACASLASTITCRDFDPSFGLVERVGSLLLSTLTTLKHQGAAFASHRALQEITSFCFATSLDDSFATLPLLWTKRLLCDISGVDNVRDSTLRRSTGYALAFLSVMRSEPPPSVAPRVLCPAILTTIIRMSLPTIEDLETYIQCMDLAPDLEKEFRSTFAATSSSHVAVAPEDVVYGQARTRVHALNILRLIILDAPLAAASRPFIEQAIVSSMIGYEDSRWAVRNSATMVFAAVMLRVVDADKNASSNGKNAITATELFRSYPVLPSFFLNVTKKGTKGMQLDSTTLSKEEAASSRFLHPSLYPVLLLLSRLQPVALSGEAAADTTESFIPTVLQCLKHKYHKCRLLGARALSNLSSDDPGRVSSVDALLEKCNEMLSVSEKQRDWNAVHGSLLGIQHLLSKASDPGLKLVRHKALRATLYRYVEPGGDIFSCPPPCVSIVLEILVNTAAAMGKSETDFEGEVERVSLNIVSKLSERHQSASRAGLVGEARLGAVASRGFCECCLGKIWDPAVDFMKRESLLNSLSLLLQHDLIDVRLEATKAFKKGIYSEIDGVLSKTNGARDAQRDVVLTVACTLQNALMSELHRTNMMHPPTARRLSRCLLECCHALRLLGFVCETDKHTTDMLSARHLWEVAMGMSELEEASAESITVLDTDKRLNGNAAELMGFAIQAWFSTGEGTITECANDELRLFMRFLNRLNDEEASWRLRHSVAVAIETSRILLLDTTSTDVKVSQLDITSEILTLLQDSDPDVRFIAGRAIMQADSRRSPQLLLEMAYGLPKRFPNGEMNSYLLQSLVASCRGIVETLDCFDSEVAQSKKDATPSELMNLGTGRKIFEDEITNPFDEVLLANQLRSMALVESPAPLTYDDTRELFELCREVLGRVFSRELENQNNNRAPDVAHEMTRSNNLFPLIHSLIVGSIAVIYLGAEDHMGLRDEARRMVSLLDSEWETAIHPSVCQAVDGLASACPSDSKTCQSVVDCCFLLQKDLD